MSVGEGAVADMTFFPSPIPNFFQDVFQCISV